MSPPDALALLMERTEGNLLAASQELAKLALLAVDGRVDAAPCWPVPRTVRTFDVAELDRALTRPMYARTAVLACDCVLGTRVDCPLECASHVAVAADAASVRFGAGLAARAVMDSTARRPAAPDGVPRRRHWWRAPRAPTPWQGADAR